MDDEQRRIGKAFDDAVTRFGDKEQCQPVPPEKLEAIQYPGLAAALLQRLALLLEEHGSEPTQ